MSTKLNLYKSDMSKRPYWLGLLISLDQFVNSLFGGYPDETISSRAFRCNDSWTWATAERIINTLFFFDRQGKIRHCELAYYGELAREQFPFEPSGGLTGG